MRFVLRQRLILIRRAFSPDPRVNITIDEAFRKGLQDAVTAIQRLPPRNA